MPSFNIFSRSLGKPRDIVKEYLPRLVNNQIAMDPRVRYLTHVPVRELVKEDQQVPWNLDDLIGLIPPTVLVGYTNPAPKGA
jgi:hypothetical protein